MPWARNCGEDQGLTARSEGFTLGSTSNHPRDKEFFPQWRVGAGRARYRAWLGDNWNQLYTPTAVNFRSGISEALATEAWAICL